MQLLGYIRDWNTSARTAPTAQLLLHAIVRLHSADTLLDAYAKGEKPGSLAAVLDALVPYTERHYARADRMLVESAMLEYTLQAMDSVLGGEVPMDDEMMGAGGQGAEDAEADADAEEPDADAEEPDVDASDASHMDDDEDE